MSDTPKLPLLRPHDAALQKCVYCPKLCRATCPVSNVEGNESVTPWGKMSLAWFNARDLAPIDEEHAEVAWACSGCHACRERCEHDNDVAWVLAEARAAYFEHGVAPAAAQRVVAEFPDHQRAYRAAVDAIDVKDRQSARTVVVIGCSYALHAPAEARAIWEVAQRFADGEVRAARSCCGLPLLQAGDRVGMTTAATQLVDEIGDAEVVLVADAGCAHTLMVEYPRLGVGPKTVIPLVDLVYSQLDRVPASAVTDRALRYHDPCQLGRGLGRYEEPRAILARLSGARPGELERCREHAECSGGGGLLPVTRPQTSRAVAEERIEAHRQAGGGTLVTACGESLRRFRSCGEEAVDLMALVAEACGGRPGVD